MNKITQAILAGGAFGQTTVTIDGGEVETFPAIPTTTYTPAVFAGIDKETALWRIAPFENKVFLNAKKLNSININLDL